MGELLAGKRDVLRVAVDAGADPDGAIRIVGAEGTDAIGDPAARDGGADLVEAVEQEDGLAHAQRGLEKGGMRAGQGMIGACAAREKFEEGEVALPLALERVFAQRDEEGDADASRGVAGERCGTVRVQQGEVAEQGRLAHARIAEDEDGGIVGEEIGQLESAVSAFLVEGHGHEQVGETDVGAGVALAQDLGRETQEPHVLQGARNLVAVMRGERTEAEGLEIAEEAPSKLGVVASEERRDIAETLGQLRHAPDVHLIPGPSGLGCDPFLFLGQHIVGENPEDDRLLRGPRAIFVLNINTAKVEIMGDSMGACALTNISRRPDGPEVDRLLMTGYTEPHGVVPISAWAWIGCVVLEPCTETPFPKQHPDEPPELPLPLLPRRQPLDQRS